MKQFVDIVFDGPPGPEAGRFIDVEDDRGHSVDVGVWVQLGADRWALRLPVSADELKQ